MNENTHATSARTHSHNQRPMKLEGIFKQLKPELQRAVQTSGYKTPTPIQAQSIPHLLEGRDLIGTAQTGTGKTAAFILPVLQRLSARPQKARRGSPQALILAPTRELAAQIGDSIKTYGRFLHLRHTVIFGGVNQFHQVKALNRGTHILVGTPGRLLDLMQQGHVELGQLEVFILDEVDRMLDMGFQPDIRRIMKQVPDRRQTLFFSATMPRKIEELAYSMVHDPVSVSIEPDQPAVERISQKVMFVGRRNKDALLLSLLKEPGINKAIVFTQMKYAANRVAKKLNAAGIHGTAIHGNKSQNARTQALDGFKSGQFRVLVATDVAARGLDVDDISHVINYDLPVEAETYVHRIGRTARAGADGDAISFCTPEDRSSLREIERLLGKPVMAEHGHAFHSDEVVDHSLPVARQPRRGNGSSERSGRSGNRTRNRSRSRRQARYSR